MNRTIIFASELFYPEESATSHILTKIATSLSSDYAVMAITGQPDYPKPHRKRPKKEVHNGVVIARCAAVSLNKNKLILRIIRALIMSMLISIKALKRAHKDDIVFMVTNPALLLFLLFFVSKIKRCKFVILVHDIFPENMVAAGLFNMRSILIRVLRLLANYVYSKADKIVVIGRDMADVMRNKIRNSKKIISVISNWADCENVVPQKKIENDLIKFLQLDQKFVVAFAGNIGRVQGIEFLLQAIAQIDDQLIHFLFIGAGAKRHLIDKHIRFGTVDNITILDYLPRDQQNVFLNACDIGLISLAHSMYGLGVPSKAYNIMAAGKPILAIVDPKSEIGLMVSEEKIGWVVEPGNIRSFMDALNNAKSDHACIEEMGRRARNVAERKYCFENIVEKYRAVINSCQ